MRIGRTPRAFAHRHLVPTIIIVIRSAAPQARSRRTATKLRDCGCTSTTLRCARHDKGGGRAHAAAIAGREGPHQRGDNNASSLSTLVASRTEVTLLRLFTSFAVISATAFGGAGIPMMRREFVTRRGWLTEREFLDIYAIAQVSPGAIPVTLAVLIGRRLAGTAASGCASSPRLSRDFSY